jgi:lipopolysaccharide biosynthesis glycosyltransferase
MQPSQVGQGVPKFVETIEGENMNILVTLNSNYLAPLKVMLKSLFINNPGEHFDIYIMHSSLKENELQSVKSMVEVEGHRLHVIFIDAACFADAPVVMHYSKGSRRQLIRMVLSVSLRGGSPLRL